MFHKWRTENAMVGDSHYDLGACTVAQLLLGYDENLSSMNDNGYYRDDGTNPCFLDEDYLENIDDTLVPAVQWDYVVMNDQSKRPAFSSVRQVSVQTLENSYVPMLLESGATPILMATHGYEANGTTMDGLGNVSDFTSRVYYGYQQYAQALAANLPNNQQPRIAPTGLGFLYLYENDYDLWDKLFFTKDRFHPSPHGTYLMGCILYTTMFGKMPPRLFLGSKYLWKRARKMDVGGRSSDAMPFPSRDEIGGLRDACYKIGLEGVYPETLDLETSFEDDDYY